MAKASFVVESDIRYERYYYIINTILLFLQLMVMRWN